MAGDRTTERITRGRLTLTIMAVQAAEKTATKLPTALRAVYAEMVGGTLPERGPGHLQVGAYGQRAVLRAPLNVLAGGAGTITGREISKSAF